MDYLVLEDHVVTVVDDMIIFPSLTKTMNDQLMEVLKSKESVMDYLVCRESAIRPRQQINSSLFPIMVKTSEGLPFYAFTPEQILEKAFKMIDDNYIGKHEYLVIPMVHAIRIKRVPRPEYDTIVESYVS